MKIEQTQIIIDLPGEIYDLVLLKNPIVNLIWGELLSINCFYSRVEAR